MENNVPFVFIDPLFDDKLFSARVYHLKTMDDAINIFKHGIPQRLYASPDLFTFDYLCGLVLAHGQLTLIIDEVDNFTTSQYLPMYFRRIVKYGRHRQIGLIAAARRPMEMNKLIRSQANRFVVFPMGGEDAKDLEEYIGSSWKDVLNLSSSNEGSQYIEYIFSEKRLYRKELRYINS